MRDLLNRVLILLNKVQEVDGFHELPENYFEEYEFLSKLIKKELNKPDGRIDAEKTKPPLIDGKDYSENVWGWDDNDNILVVSYFDYGDECGWANCYGDVFGESQFDDDYDIRFWKRINFPESPK